MSDVTAGTMMLLGLGSANRDPERFGDDAEQVDIRRVAARDALSFGAGPHFCLGAVAGSKRKGHWRSGPSSIASREVDLAGAPVWNPRSPSAPCRASRSRWLDRGPQVRSVQGVKIERQDLHAVEHEAALVVDSSGADLQAHVVEPPEERSHGDRCLASRQRSAEAEVRAEAEGEVRGLGRVRAAELIWVVEVIWDPGSLRRTRARAQRQRGWDTPELVVLPGDAVRAVDRRARPEDLLQERGHARGIGPQPIGECPGPERGAASTMAISIAVVWLPASRNCTTMLTTSAWVRR